MFSRDGEVTSLADACDTISRRGHACFLRPDADCKKFDGGLFGDYAVNALAAKVGSGERVVLAENRAIDAEWRVCG
jgi:hypothetical protein